ncbi:hypothetical protein [Candidatus Cyanaurora vandensis]|uniref:hypothetical protein n=1 Tax=Candidatus Cyanaurora vandensis TaxID=2714958 RepID=UPI00257DBEAE|nr:hypothetical protein [Candidatus Cyanaurora vandensis]
MSRFAALSPSRVTASYEAGFTYVVFRNDLGLVDAVNYLPTGQVVPYTNRDHPMTEQLIAWMQVNQTIDFSPAPSGYEYAPAFY